MKPLTRHLARRALLVALLTTLSSVGCSTLERRVYFSPFADHGVTRRAPTCADAAGTVLGGADDRIVIGEGRTQLELRAPVVQRTMTAGIFFFPVVPVFPLGWLFPSGFSTGDPSERLRVDIRIAQAPGSLRLKAPNVTVSIAPEGIPLKASELEPFINWGEGTTGIPRSRGHWVARFPIPRKKVDAFTLQIDGLRLDGEPMPLKPVQFDRAAGWTFCPHF